MLVAEARTMAKPKGRPKKKELSTRTTVINLKGSEDLAAWLERMHEDTRWSKAEITRMAYVLWAEKHNKEAPPKE